MLKIHQSENQVPKKYIRPFMLGGNCKAVIQNTTTKEQRRFSIKAQYPPRIKEKRIEFITHWSVFNGMPGEPTYIGKIDLELLFHPYAKDILAGKGYHPLIKNFSWLWKHITDDTLPTDILIMHTGICGVCGRALEDAESLKRGIGPICWRRIESYINQKQ